MTSYLNRAYTECAPETAVWCVPHDPEGLAELIGGKDAVVKRLDEFFDALFWKPERGVPQHAAQKVSIGFLPKIDVYEYSYLGS